MLAVVTLCFKFVRKTDEQNCNICVLRLCNCVGNIFIVALSAFFGGSIALSIVKLNAHLRHCIVSRVNLNGVDKR